MLEYVVNDLNTVHVFCKMISYLCKNNQLVSLIHECVV